MRSVSKIFLGIGAVVIVGVVAIIWLISALYAAKTDESLEKTMNTLEPSFVITTDTAAIDAVRKRTEVFKYELELSKAGKAASFRAEDRGEEWAVQVFEIVNEGDSGHTATMNWYTVNKRTGGIEPEFSFTEETTSTTLTPTTAKEILTASSVDFGVNRLDLESFNKQECRPSGQIGPSKKEPFGSYGATKLTYTCGDGGGYEDAVMYVSADNKPMFYYRGGNLTGGIEFQRSEDKVSYGITATYSVVEPCSGELGGFDGKIKIEEISLNNWTQLHSGNANLPFVQNGCDFSPTNFTVLDQTFFNATFEVAGKKFIINLRTPQPFLFQFGDSAAYNRGLD